MAERKAEFHGALFHGTANDFDTVRPASQVGEKGFGDSGSQYGEASRDHAFASSDEAVGWRFAKIAADAQTKDHHRGEQARPAGRTRVYTVAPHPEMRPGSHLSEREFLAPSFKVTGRIDTKPGHQGTFPTLNWNQFHVWNRPSWDDSRPGDANHPTPHEVEHGMDKTPSEVAEQKKYDRVIENPNPVAAGQMDLYTGKTAAEHQAGHGSDKGLNLYHGYKQGAFVSRGFR